MKPNCHDCKYRGNVPGDAHSCCNHPKASLYGLLYLLSQPVVEGIRIPPLNIEADPHGVRSGWFMWPMNFDPIWLLNCDGFEAKTVESTVQK